MTLTFDGTELTAAYNCYAFRDKTDNTPARDGEGIEVSGRSGNLFDDKKRWPNVDLSYVLLFNTESDFNGCKAFLASKVGYKVLSDSEHPSEFYKAFLNGEISPTIDRQRRMFKFRARFERKPQRYLTTGSAVTSLTASGSITNPTLFDSQPLFRVYGNGTLGVGAYSLTITNADGYTDIDSEMQDCFKGSVSMNNYVTLTGHKFPLLVPGSNGITLGTGITNVKITPRWYTI